MRGNRKESKRRRREKRLSKRKENNVFTMPRNLRTKEREQKSFPLFKYFKDKIYVRGDLYKHRTYEFEFEHGDYRFSIPEKKINCLFSFSLREDDRVKFSISLDMDVKAEIRREVSYREGSSDWIILEASSLLLEALLFDEAKIQLPLEMISNTFLETSAQSVSARTMDMVKEKALETVFEVEETDLEGYFDSELPLIVYRSPLLDYVPNENIDVSGIPF